MAGATAIEWTEATWNPIVGCSVVSPGCTNCYAMRMAARLEAMGQERYRGLTAPSKAGHIWTGKVALADEATLLAPLRRRKQTTYFVNSMGDLFHEDVPEEWIDNVFAVMALCSQHTFQVLTKRSGRMRAYCSDPTTPSRIYDLVCDLAVTDSLDVLLIAPGIDPALAPPGRRVHLGLWPLANVWLGVSTEDQRRADERIPGLLATPAAIRFVSAEPLLGPVDLRPISLGTSPAEFYDSPHITKAEFVVDALRGAQSIGWRGLDWVIAGGESGPGARPMHPDWARALRDQCAAAKVPFFFKQWGEWLPVQRQDDGCEEFVIPDDGDPAEESRLFGMPPRPCVKLGRQTMCRVGKRLAGRLLDGRLHDAMPSREARP